MNTPDDTTLVTQQRRERGNVQTKPRIVSQGGNVASVGQVDLWHHYLNFIHEKGLLGPEPLASRRRDNGLKFYELWALTHPSEKSNISDPTPGGQPGDPPVSADDIGTDSDCRDMEWHLACKYLGQHRHVVEVYCTQIPPPARPLEREEIVGLEVPDQARALAINCIRIAELSKHLIAFSLARQMVHAALDALPKAMERAHEEAWKDSQR